MIQPIGTISQAVATCVSSSGWRCAPPIDREADDATEHHERSPLSHAPGIPGSLVVAQALKRYLPQQAVRRPCQERHLGHELGAHLSDLSRLERPAEAAIARWSLGERHLVDRERLEAPAQFAHLMLLDA
jgi:hypothetical protein